MHDRQSRKSTPGVGGFFSPESEGSANDESDGWSSIYFSVSSFWHCCEQSMSAMMFVTSLPIWRLSLFGQLSPAAPYWRSLAGEEMISAITDASYAAFQTLILKRIHSKAMALRFN